MQDVILPTDNRANGCSFETYCVIADEFGKNELSLSVIAMDVAE